MCRKGENIRKRKDGRWEARYIKWRDADGKIHYGSLYGKSYNEVKEKRRKKLQKHPHMVWCDLLISSVFSETISYGLMLRLVENGIVTESEISELLEDKYNIKKDYEWYSEDFMGCELDESTDIRIEDVWELCAERVEKVVGAKI